MPVGGAHHLPPLINRRGCGPANSNRLGRCCELGLAGMEFTMKNLPGVEPMLESEKQAIDQGLVHGMFASRLFLPPETFEEMLKETAAQWQNLGCDPRFIQLGLEAARAAFRCEKIELGGRFIRLADMTDRQRSDAMPGEPLRKLAR